MYPPFLGKRLQYCLQYFTADVPQIPGNVFRLVCTLTSLGELYDFVNPQISFLQRRSKTATKAGILKNY